jgi:hypothetical protein
MHPSELSTEQRALPPAGEGRQGWPWEDSPAAPPTLPAGQAWPRITVVTPSFNQGQFLEATLRSVLLQGYPNLEYLVVDGGSTDDSVTVIRCYAPWLDGWVSEADRGQSHAIEKGFAQANGEILAWLNSDDIYTPGTLFTIARLFLEHPEAVLVHGAAEYIHPDGQRRPGRPRAQPYDRRWMLEHSNLIPQPSAFIRAAAYRAAGGLDETLHYVMDWDLWLRLDKLGPAVFTPQVLSKIRIYPEAKTQAGGARMDTELRRVIERHGGQGLPLSARERLAERHWAAAFEAAARGDEAQARADAAYVFANAPEWQGDLPRVTQTLAETAWNAFKRDQRDPLALAARVLAVLPPQAGPPARLRGETLGLLHEALAFHHLRLAQGSRARRHAWQAMRHSARQVRNRGLWSVAARSMGLGLTRRPPRA